MIRRQRDFPKTILINGRTWRVQFRRRLIFEGKPAWGLCHRETRLIEISMSLTPIKRYEIYWHELLHALSAEHGFTLAHPTIYNLQGPISQFLRENQNHHR